MFIVITFSLIALLLTYLESIGKMRNGMRWGFVLVTFLACIHYDYGNDYMAYYQNFIDIVNTPFNLRAIMDGEVYREPGWALLCYMFKPIGGFFVMVAVLNIIQNVIVYRFIKNNVSDKWRVLSVFVYLFSTSLYLMNFSMMRQGLVACIFLGLWTYINKRRWWIPLIVLFLCSFIHKSAIFLLPFAFFGFVPIKRSALYGYIILFLYIALWFGGDFVNTIFISTLSFEEIQEYVNTYGAYPTKGRLGLGFIMYQVPLFLTIYYFFSNKEQNTSTKQIVAIAAMASMITPFAQILPMLSRFGTYFSIFLLAALPAVYSNISNPALKKLFLSIQIFMLSYDYLMFFQSPVWVEKFTTFHTIFEAL